MSLTILQALNGKVLTKRFYSGADGEVAKTPYDNCKYFDAVDHHVEDIFSLSALLTDMESQPDLCIIRGAIKGGDSAGNVRRLLYDDLEKGDQAWFEEKPRPWVLIDFDGVPVPEWLPEDLRLTYLIDMLPDWFEGVTYHYRWSASAGMDGWETLSAHCWFWLTEPWRSDLLRKRIDIENWDCDASPFDPVHIHYTAAPIFDGVEDPIAGQRSGLIKGERDAVHLPDFRQPVIPYVPKQFRPAATSFEKKFQEMLDKIGPNYHQPIRNAIRFYVGNAPNIDEYDLKSRIEDAIAIAPSGRSPKSQYNSTYLNRSINGAIRKFS